MSMHSKNKSTQNLSFFRWFNHVIKFSLLEENFENLLLKSVKMNQLKYNIFFKKNIKICPVHAEKESEHSRHKP